MKRKFVLLIIISIILIVIKFLFSNYKLNYKIGEYDILTKYSKNRYYFEIKNDNTYNFDIYSKRKIKKVVINDIKELEVEKYNCILPIIKGYDTYPLCYDIENNYLVDYHLIDDEVLKEYKKESVEIEKNQKDFTFFNNLNSNEYIALWTYTGYNIMNGKEYTNVKIFNKDRYDNDLAHMIGDNIFMPNYDQEHEFDNLIKLNIVSQKTSNIKLSKKIDYDSYVVGNIKNKLYIFDNKSSVLYEINTKNGEIKTIGSGDKGYVKYLDGKFVKCSKSEYKVDKIKIESNVKSNYTYDIDNYVLKSYVNNKKVKTLISNEPIAKVFELNNKLYYIKDNYYYVYTPTNGSTKIFYDYELSFNNTKAVFMYIK